MAIILARGTDKFRPDGFLCAGDLGSGVFGESRHVVWSDTSSGKPDG
jgi:hypothetical protein